MLTASVKMCVRTSGVPGDISASLPLPAPHSTLHTWLCHGRARSLLQRATDESQRVNISSEEVSEQSDVRNGQTQRVDLGHALLVGKCGHVLAQLLQHHITR